MSDTREKLSKLMVEAYERCWSTMCPTCKEYDKRTDNIRSNCQANLFADYLIAHGVTFADVPDTDFGKMPKCKYKEMCGYDICTEEDCPKYKPAQETNADRIRAIISTDEGLAKVLFNICDSGVHIPFCKNKNECLEERDLSDVPEIECMKCMIEWLREPYKEDETNAKEKN